MRSTVDFEILKKSLVYAAENSPFYIRLFAEYGINVEKVKSIEDFREVPYSDKTDLREVYPWDFRQYRMRRLSESILPLGQQGSL